MNRNIENNTNIRKDNKGFTLVEIIVVMVILAIILGLTTMGIISWQEWSYFKKQDDFAQDLFVAAQNQLTEFEANGYLATLAEKLPKEADGSYSTKLDLTAISDANGNGYKLDEVWYESGTGEDAAKYRGDLVYVSCKKGDYALYLADNSLTQSDAAKVAKATGADVLFELVKDYVYDPSILDAAISIEFAPGEGQVFSVCYSDRTGEFVYGDVAKDNDAKADIRNRKESDRKEKMVGYYGVDTIATSTTASIAASAKLIDVTLNNAETLNLSFKVSNDSGRNLVQLLDYDIKVLDASNKNVLLEIDLDGTKVSNYAARKAVECDVKKHLSNGSTVTKTYDLLCWIDTGKNLHIVFDAVDLDVSSKLYASNIQAIINDPYTDFGKDTPSGKLTNSFSFHRFGLDVDDIKCLVSGKGKDKDGADVSTQTVPSNTSNVFFAGTTVMDGKYVCSIKNARHLYNVRYLEDLQFNTVKTVHSSVFAENAQNTQPKSITFAVMKNFDWSDFVDSGNVYASSGSIAGEIIGTVSNATSKVVANAAFPSITQLRIGDEFVGGLDQKIPVISGLKVNRLANEALQVYDSKLMLPVDKDENGNIKIKPAGMFVYNYGTIRNVALDRVNVTGTDKVGAVCGVNAGSIKFVTVLNSGFESVVSGMNDVGGIIGYQLTVDDSAHNGGTPSSVELKSLTNRAMVEGMLRVGGIVGRVYMPESQTNEKINVTISDCKNYGGIKGVYYDENGNKSTGELTPQQNRKVRFLGGITGLCDNRSKSSDLLVIENCISSPEFSNSELEQLFDSGETEINNTLKKKLRGIYVGGIVGYNYYGTIINCNTESEDGKAGYVFGYKYVGGIVGFNQGPASGIRGGTDSTNVGVNAANVIGYEYVGGITGCNADITNAETFDIYEGVVEPNKTRQMSVCLENWTNKGIVYAAGQYGGGITGYNAGRIFNCHSEVEAPASGSFFRRAYAGDYIGGIAGYNNGIIGNTSYAGEVRGASQGTIEAVCYISGTNYVGGIVGYNDVNAVIEDYALAGGYVHGNPAKSCYVGGYVGFNASMDLLMKVDADGKYVARDVEAHPYEVTGQYFVGGCIGGNILNANGYNGTKPSPTPDSTPPNTPLPSGYVTDDNAYVDVTTGVVHNNNDKTISFSDVEIKNLTGKTITDWYIDFSMLKTHGAFEVVEIKEDKYIFDPDTMRIYPNQDSNRIFEPNEELSISFKIISTGNGNNGNNGVLNKIEKELSNTKYWRIVFKDPDAASPQSRVTMTEKVQYSTAPKATEAPANKYYPSTFAAEGGNGSSDYKTDDNVYVQIKDGINKNENKSNFQVFNNSSEVAFDWYIDFSEYASKYSFSLQSYSENYRIDGNRVYANVAIDNGCPLANGQNVWANFAIISDNDAFYEEIKGKKLPIYYRLSPYFDESNTYNVTLEPNSSTLSGYTTQFDLKIKNTSSDLLWQYTNPNKNNEKNLVFKITYPLTSVDKVNINGWAHDFSYNGNEITIIPANGTKIKPGETLTISFNVVSKSDQANNDDPSIIAFMSGFEIEINAGDSNHKYTIGKLPTPTPTPSPTPENTPIETPTPSPRPTATPMPSPTQSISAGLVPVPTSVPEESVKDAINAHFRNDNFIGQLTGEAFIGGYIGYNRFVDIADVDAETVSQYIKRLADDLKTRITNVESGSYENESKKLGKIYDKVELASKNDLNGKVKDSNKVLCINNTKIDGKIKVVKNNIGGIKGGIFVGGVFGYNAENTKLSIYNIENSSMITAEYAIENPDEQRDGEQPRTKDYDGSDITYTYSYAGGIVGRVGANMKLVNCANDATATVTSEGTYTGGLCEVNAGIITNCTVYSFGSSVIDYLGGIAGLNKNGATIINCSVGKEATPGSDTKEGATLSGRSVVGGIAAENFGTISSVKISSLNLFVSGKELQINDATVRAAVAGGIVGFNGNTGVISLSKPATSLTILSNGENVGGLIGINEGSIKRQEFPKDENGQELSDEKKLNYYRVSGKITGLKNVGGIVGTNRSEEGISWLTNNATITAANGNAGGIVGINERGPIRYCTNLGKIIATVEGNAGGITAVNKGGASEATKTVIEYCVNKDTVTSKNGIGAGIVALNGSKDTIFAEINNCSVEPQKATDDVTFASLEVAGGICGANYGTITNPAVKNITVQNQTNSDVSDIGVVAGRNMATGVIKLAASVDKRSGSTTVVKAITGNKVRTYKNRCNLGGVVGANYGQVSGAAPWDGLPTTIIDVDIALHTDHAEQASMGGVAGINAGTIENISTNGNVIGNLGSDVTGYGGIVGVSEKLAKDSEETAISKAVLVSTCTFDGTVRANGTGGAYARIGGIVGLNNADSKIAECAIGVLDGGVTNVFAGNVEVDDPSKSDVTNKYKGWKLTKIASDIVSYSYTGGITGENFGIVLSCDNNKYGQDNVTVESFAGILGGIIGVNREKATVCGIDGKPVSTGSKWKVISRSASNDIGYGGIVGNNYSGVNVQYLDNYAYVQALYDSNTTVAGIFGRIEQNVNYDYKITNCVNYGEIVGSNRVAGIVGMIKGKGITIENSINYGLVESAGTGGKSSGIICEINSAVSAIKIINTKNHGLIKANSGVAFGFIQYFSTPNSSPIYMVDCVNTGLISTLGKTEEEISATAKGAHFVCDVGNNFITFINCRNYAPSVQGGNNSMLYSFALKATKARFENCLDYSSYISSDHKQFNNYATDGNYRCSYYNNYFVSNEKINQVEKVDYEQNDVVALKLLSNEETTTEWTMKAEKTMEANALLAINMTDNNPIAPFGSTVYEKYDPRYDDPNSNVRPEKNSRLAVYLEMDEKYEKFLDKMELINCTDLQTTLQNMKDEGKPFTVTVGEYNGNYALQWNEVVGAAGYEVYYELYQGNNKVYDSSEDVGGLLKYSNSDLFYTDIKVNNVMYGALKVLIDVSEIYSHWPDIELKNDKIRFYVRPICNEYLQDDNKLCNTDYVIINKSNLLTEILPMPIVHMELINGNYMVAVLDNPEDFKDYIGACNIVYQPGVKSRLLSNLSNTTDKISFKVQEKTLENGEIEYYGYSEPFKLEGDTMSGDKITDTSSNNDKSPKAQAEPVSGKRFAKSVFYCLYATLPSSLDMENIPASITDKKLITAIITSFIGFENTTIDDLVYRVNLFAFFKDFTVMSDIVAPDKKLGLDVAYSFGSVKAANRVSSSTGVNFITDLKKFASNVIEKPYFEVRTYHMNSQANIEYYGHEVAKGVTLNSIDDVKNISDDKYYMIENETVHIVSRSIYDETTGKLRPGYVVGKNEDGTYDIWYNALLEMDETDPTKNYHVQRIKYTLETDSNGNAATDSNGYRYYTWVQEINGDTVKSSDPGQSPIKINAKPVVESDFAVNRNVDTGKNEYTFKWDQNVDTASTLYKNAKYYVELMGETADGEKVFLKAEDVGTARTYTAVDENDNWKYVKLYLTVCRLGEGETGKPTTILPSMTEKVYDTKLKMTTLAMPSVVLASKDGTYNKNDLIYNTTWDAAVSISEKAALAGYLVKAEVLVPTEGETTVTPTHYLYIKKKDCEGLNSESDVVDFIKKNHDSSVQAAMCTMDESQKTGGAGAQSDNCSALLDLTYYKGGEVIGISVMAVADPNADKYTDSEYSEAFELSLPKRLSTPNLNKMSVASAYTAESISIKQLNAGIPVTLTSDTKEKGRYEFAIAIYDQAGKLAQDNDSVAKKGSTSEIKKTGDATVGETGCWNSGALCTLYTKENPVIVGGDLKLANYTINVNSSSARMSDYAGMWVKVAARAVYDNKISSRWTDSAEGQVNYFWFQIPKAKLADLGFSMSSQLRYKDNTGVFGIQPTEIGEVVENRMFSFKTIDYADGYVLGINKGKFSIYLDKVDDTYKVYIGTSEADAMATKAENQRGVLKLVETENGKTMGTVIIMDYTGGWTIKELTGDASTVTELDTIITLNVDGTISVILPDVIRAGNGGDLIDCNYGNTGMVEVKAVVDSDKEKRYEMPDARNWQK